MSRMIDAEDLVSAEQIALRCKVVPSAVSNWQTTIGRNFPEPVFANGRTKVWLWADVAVWLEDNPNVGQTRRNMPKRK